MRLGSENPNNFESIQQMLFLHFIHQYRKWIWLHSNSKWKYIIEKMEWINPKELLCRTWGSTAHVKHWKCNKWSNWCNNNEIFTIFDILIVIILFIIFFIFQYFSVKFKTDGSVQKKGFDLRIYPCWYLFSITDNTSAKWGPGKYYFHPTTYLVNYLLLANS